MISLLLAVLLAVAPPSGYHDKVKATWYGSTSGYKTHCYQGYKNTCNPYLKGEKVMYAAVPGFRNYRTEPYPARVCSEVACVMVIVRDCLCSRKGSNYIDLSPAAFIALGSRLSRGAIWVSVDYEPYGRR
jgi:hypothetical protein